MTDHITRAESGAIIAQARHEAFATGHAAGMSASGASSTDPAAAFKQGAEDERARCAAIIGAPEAEGRHDLAHHLALCTDMAPDAAKSLLAVTPKVEQLQTRRRTAVETRIESSREAWGEVMRGVNADAALDH